MYKNPKEAFLKRITDNVSAIDVIGSFVNLISSENDEGFYYYSCPFCGAGNLENVHENLMVDKHRWYCPNCKRAGDVICFVMDYKNLNLSEAAMWLAEEYNINYSDEDFELSYGSHRKSGIQSNLELIDAITSLHDLVEKNLKTKNIDAVNEISWIFEEVLLYVREELHHDH